MKRRIIMATALMLSLSSCSVTKLFEDGSAIIKDDKGAEFGVCLIGSWGCADGGTPSVFVGDAPMPVPSWWRDDVQLILVEDLR